MMTLDLHQLCHILTFTLTIHHMLTLHLLEVLITQVHYSQMSLPNSYSFKNNKAKLLNFKAMPLKLLPFMGRIQTNVYFDQGLGAAHSKHWSKLCRPLTNTNNYFK